MKARYELNQRALSEMSMTVEVQMTLKDWTELREALRSTTSPRSSIVEQFHGLVGRVLDQCNTATSAYWESTPYRTDEAKEQEEQDG